MLKAVIVLTASGRFNQLDLIQKTRVRLNHLDLISRSAD